MPVPRAISYTKAAHGRLHRESGEIPLLHGFTLIELLVVITVIVVLISLLAPALDRAVDQAQLAVCGATVRSGVSAGMQYAFDHKRSYPLRGLGGWMPNFVRDESSPNDPATHYDLITALRPYAGLDVFTDPFVTGVDLDPDPAINDPITQLIANQCWYYNWGGGNWRMRKTIRRVGDRMDYQAVEESDAAGNPVFRTSSVLVSDFDMYTVSERQYYAGHPDELGGLFEHIEQNANNPYFLRLPAQKVTLDWWESTEPPITNATRGALNSNYGFEDGSVNRYDNVEIHDPRMSRVQDGPNLGAYTRGQQLPRNK